MKKTVLGILLLCTLLLIRPAAALASGPSCDFCGRDVTFVKLKTYSHYHEFIYWCDSCKMNTRRAASHTGGTATCTERAVCEVCNEPYGGTGRTYGRQSYVHRTRRLRSLQSVIWGTGRTYGRHGYMHRTRRLRGLQSAIWGTARTYRRHRISHLHHRQNL